MTIIILLYILLLIGFISASAFIFRHMVKYGHLSPRFKTVIGFYGVISIIVIIFSIFLISSSETGSSNDYNNDYSNSSSSNDLNF